MRFCSMWITVLAILVSSSCLCPVEGQGSYDLALVADLQPPGLFVASTDTFNFTTIPGFEDRLRRPVAIDYDPVDAMVYWTDVEHGSISRSLLDGSSHVVLLTGLQTPDGLTLDLSAREMYWTDTGGDLIEKATLDGLDRRVVLNLTDATQDVVEPRAIVVDPANGIMFWTDWGSSPKIERANTDGTSRRVLVDSGLQWPNGLALDVDGGRLFWCDAGLNTIESVDVNGGSRVLYANVTSHDIHPFDIWHYRSQLFWTDWISATLFRLEFSPLNIAGIGSISFSKAAGLHIHTDAFQDHSCADLMPCDETSERCRQFDTSYQCVCKDGPAGAACSRVNPCSGDPCNDGECFQKSAGTSVLDYFCQCPFLSTGTNCEIPVSPCQSNPCMNGALCFVSNSNDIYVCHCPGGFTGVNCESKFGAYNLAFVANLDPPGIYVAQADTFNFTLIPGSSSTSRPVAVDYDPVDGRVYWTDVALSTIHRSFLDGSGMEVLVNNTLLPDGLTLDIENRVMYWTDTGSDLIEKATMDGLNRTVVLNLIDSTRNQVEPRAIILDTDNRYLFWTDWGTSPRIERAYTDGSGRRVLVNTNLVWPNGLALDSQGGRLYWCDASTDRVEFSDLNGNGRSILVDLTSYNIHPFDIAFYDGSVYWTDWRFSLLGTSVLESTTVNAHGTVQFLKAGGLHIYEDTNLDHSCQNGQPCQNYGFCHQYALHYECTCLPGFTGVSCEIRDINECSPNPCSNGGTCSDLVNDFTCTCVQGWTGAYCQININDCLPNECVNGGTCVDLVNGFSCTCSPGWAGVRCEMDINECASSPCVNGGTCVDLVNAFSCTCMPGWNGDRCEINNVCSLSPCFNGGTCSDLVNGFTCSCVQGWTGAHCEINFNECASSPCVNGGTCVDSVNAFSCTCSSGWTGVRCEINIDECASSPCVNGGTCVDLVNAFSCTCMPGWNGVRCEINIDECASSPCVNGGTCVDSVNAFSCTCSPGWTGVRCEINSVDCTPTSCLNGGTCVDGLNSFTCICRPGYTGSRCDNDIDECESSPCKNGATCLDEVNRFSCTCPRGFEGNTCATDNEPPMVTGCPDGTSIPVTTPTARVTHSWTPPTFMDNSGPPTESFGCSSTGYKECHQSGSGVFGVGVTKVMYNATDGARKRTVCFFTVKVTVVDIVCPMNLSVLAPPGAVRSSVDWNEPVITAWAGPTNFTSTALPGKDTFLIGTHRVSYTQHFVMYNVVLECSFFISIGGQCDVIITPDSTLNRTIKWQPTAAGQTAESFERCTLITSLAGEPIALRDCVVVDPPTYFEWLPDYKLLGCGEAFKPTVEDVADQVDVTEGNAEEVAIFIADQTQDNTTTKEDVEVADVTEILVKIADAGSGNPQVTDAVVETVNNIIENPNTNDDLANDNGVSSSAIVQSVEAQISATLQQEGSITIQQPSIHVEGVSINPMEANSGFSFVSVQQSGGSQESGSLEGTEVRTFESTSEIPQDIEVVASVQLPKNILQSATGDNSSQLQASFIVYAGDDLFQSSLIRGNSSIEVAGPVVSLTVEGVDLVNLTEPLVIELRVPNNGTSHDDTSFRCVFWDFSKIDGVGDWSTAGCVLARQTNNTVSCNCDHATNFAVLVDVKGQKASDHKFVYALDLISQIGIVLSIIALSATLIIYLSIKKLRAGKSRQIFIHFCVSLLLLYIVFLTGVDNARGKGGACTFVAALLHYLALTTMMWMAVEARNMYISTVKVFPEDTSRYMLKACLIAWGSPLLVVIITLASATRYYGSKHNCFISPGLAMYLGLLVPIAIILLHNIVTFILVMRSLLKVEEVSRSQQISKRLQNAIGISALMGLTWVFGFLAIGRATLAFQLIFCLANSLQGVVVCIMFCVRREEVRSAMGPYIRRICCCYRFWRLPGFVSDKTHEVELVTSSSVPNSPSSISNTAQFDLSVSAQE